MVSLPSCKLPDEFGPSAGFGGCFLQNIIKSHTASGEVFVLILEVLRSNRYLGDPKKPAAWEPSLLCSLAGQLWKKSCVKWASKVDHSCPSSRHPSISVVPPGFVPHNSPDPLPRDTPESRGQPLSHAALEPPPTSPLMAS